jgi:hypothetical protein
MALAVPKVMVGYMKIRETLFGLVCAVLLLGAPRAHAAQTGPDPKGTVALEGTVQKTYAAANSIIVNTADGMEHLVHFTKRTLVHGASAANDAFQGLEKGSHVVVHYAAEGDQKTAVEVDRVGEDGLKTMEGTVTHVDRKGQTLSIKLADGSKETLRLTERAAADVGEDVDRAADDAPRVIVYYTDEAGERVAHFFKRIR